MSCGCASCEDNLLIDPVVIPTGSNGTNGINGSNGDFGGYSADWLFENVTSGSPSSKSIRLNNSVLSSVTEVMIHKTNKANISYDTFLDQIVIGSTIRIFKEFETDKVYIGKITNISEGVNSYVFTTSIILSNGSFTNGDTLIASFIGPLQPSVGNDNIANDATLSDFTLAANTSDQVARLLTLSANPFLVNGDAIRINFSGKFVNIGASYKIKVYVEDGINTAWPIVSFQGIRDGNFKGTCEYMVNNRAAGTWKSQSQLVITDTTLSPSETYLESYGSGSPNPLDFIAGTMKVKLVVASSNGASGDVVVYNMIVERIKV